MTRLIDADALKKAFEDTLCITPMPDAVVKQIIDNAPTVDTDLSEYSEKLWKEAYNRGHKEGYQQAILDRRTNF